MRKRIAVCVTAAAVLAACGDGNGGGPLGWELNISDGSYALATVDDTPVAEQPAFTGMQAAPALTSRCAVSAGPDRRMVSGSVEIKGDSARVVFDFVEWCQVNGRAFSRDSRVEHRGRLGPPAPRGPRQDEGDGSNDDGPGVPRYSAKMFTLLGPDNVELARGSTEPGIVEMVWWTPPAGPKFIFRAQ